MAIQIISIEQNTEEWHKVREGRATGSNADSLLSGDLAKALSLNDKDKQFRGNYFTDRGHKLEPIAIKTYELIHDCKVDRPGFVINDEYPNAGCSPDGIHKDWLIEVKCFAEKRHLEIKTHKDIPFKIMAQLQFNMMISGLRKSRLVMYNPDLKLGTPQENNIRAYCEIEVTANPIIQRNMARKLRAQ
jgi:hypothetical protein